MGEVQSLKLVIGEGRSGIIVGKVLGLVAQGFQESGRLKGVLPSMSLGPLSFDQESPYVKITPADFQLGLGVPLRGPDEMLLEQIKPLGPDHHTTEGCLSWAH